MTDTPAPMTAERLGEILGQQPKKSEVIRVTVGEYISVQAARIAELEAERDQWKLNHEALQDKFDCNKTCGCAYDFADALCGYHSPRVIAAEARALALEMAFLDYLRWENSCRNPGPICTDMQRCGCWLEMQAALAQPKVTP